MNAPLALRELAAHDNSAAPFDFDEFERRRELRARKRRTTLWSFACSASVLGLVGVLALLTQAPQPAAELTAAAIDARDEQPALVDLGRFAVTSELEDHIALLDAEISAARVAAIPTERLHEMESARAEMNESLQRVSYAHSLLSL